MTGQAQTKVLITDIHHRITGVGATIRNLLPHHSDHCVLVTSLMHQPAQGKEALSLLQALRLCRQANKPMIWHARRNNEMLWGLIFKYLFRCPLKLVFTSAAKRRHSAFPRWLISKMDAVIATSDEARAHMDAINPQLVKAVIEHGVDTQRFVPKSLEQQVVLKEALGLTNKRHIGIFGRIRPEKGTDLFVEMLLQLLPKYQDVDAVIVGLATKKFQSFAQQLKDRLEVAGLAHRVHWLGELGFEQMPNLYPIVDIAVAPARYEGFGLVPLEAMACECAFVATDTGAYRRIINEGETGFVVPIEDQHALCARVEVLLEDSDKCKLLGRQGRERVVSNFGIAKECDAIEAVYQSLLDLSIPLNGE